MRQQYLIPANSKKGQLIFNLFQPIDLGILISGAFITLVMVFAFPSGTLLTTFLKLLPLGIAIILVFPVAFYHNVRVFLQEALLYLSEQKRYHWRGWCSTYGINESEEQRK